MTHDNPSLALGKHGQEQCSWEAIREKLISRRKNIAAHLKFAGNLPGCSEALLEKIILWTDEMQENILVTFNFS